MAKFRATIFGQEHDRDTRKRDYGGSPTSSQNFMSEGPLTANYTTLILPPSENSAFFVIARSSADRTQPNIGGKPR